MPDIIDSASEIEELQRNNALAVTTQQYQQRIAANVTTNCRRLAGKLTRAARCALVARARLSCERSRGVCDERARHDF